MMEARLREVGTSEVLATRSFENDEQPDWYPPAGEGNGEMKIGRWDDGQVVIHLSTAMQGESHAVKVTISGLFDVDEDFFELPEEDQREFASTQISQLTPFLRQAIYNASALVWPVKPIMLDARPDSIVMGKGELIQSDSE